MLDVPVRADRERHANGSDCFLVEVTAAMIRAVFVPKPRGRENAGPAG